MQASFVFYVHHHGSGHLMRALAIASHLQDARITFLGSGLAPFRNVIPGHIQCIHLPVDVPGPGDPFASQMKLSFMHYVPLNVANVAARAAAVTSALHTLFPSVLIVDVSVEITLLATLSGTPTVVIRQNGDRDDAAHLHAYECAQLLIAPSPEVLMNVSKNAWVNEKTFFSGGFSKYSGKRAGEETVRPRSLGIIVGSGGTSLNGAVINHIASQCPDRSIHVIGKLAGNEKIVAANVVDHGQLDEPLGVLSQCEIIVGNAGHNTVMEMADLAKKFICVPEERPFQEQFLKAELLKKQGMAVVVQPGELENADWESIISKAEKLPGNAWEGVISNSALADISQRLHDLWESCFSKKQ